MKCQCHFLIWAYISVISKPANRNLEVETSYCKNMFSITKLESYVTINKQFCAQIFKHTAFLLCSSSYVTQVNHICTFETPQTKRGVGEVGLGPARQVVAPPPRCSEEPPSRILEERKREVVARWRTVVYSIGIISDFNRLLMNNNQLISSWRWV